jgi:peptidoglycan lytic transglycosylase G
MKKVVGLLLLVAIVAGGAAAGMAWTRLQTPYKGYTSTEQFVEIPARAGAAEIRQRLVDAGVVQDGLTLRLALRWTGASRDLKAGEYRFERAMTAVEVVQKIAHGDVYGQRITFPEGLTIREMATIYESRGLGRARDFISASRSTALIQNLDPAASDLEGYLFPDTYTVGRTVGAVELIEKMVAGFRAAYPADPPPPTSDQPSLNTRQVVTLASLIEKETAKPEERPLVSAVYRNRLRIGMGMQADPTVVYALQKAGKYDGNIRKEDLGINSPYNTYKYPGLPPGPIASPGQASLAAALNPADAPFLYFVSRNDGSHVFATTLAEHNRNVQEFQVRYFQKQRSGR